MLKGEIWTELRSRYSEPHRVFHTWSRIGDMLAMAEDVVNGIAERTAFILAILFHKVVFKPRSADAAAHSTALMHQLLAGTTSAASLRRAEALILAVDRQEIPTTKDISLRGDAAILLDFDRAVLGTEEHRFTEYETAIRQEIPDIRDDAYRSGRSAALQMLLWQDRIYLTDRFYLEREKRARRNIEVAIAKMQDLHA